MKSLEYADEQIEHFRKLDGMTDELLRIIRLELITAYRAGYEEGEKKQK